jgi:hypothetical protein
MVDASGEHLLNDSFIVFKGFIYLVDHRPQRSPITGTVAELKRELSAHEVRRCDIARRRDIFGVRAFAFDTGNTGATQAGV